MILWGFIRSFAICSRGHLVSFCLTFKFLFRFAPGTSARGTEAVGNYIERVSHVLVVKQMTGGGEENQESPPWITMKSWVEDQYKKTRENIETYPYVWASYIVVYGGLGIYTAYRWNKLRRTEARVRVLQERLKKLAESQESTTLSKSNGSVPQQPRM